MLIEEVRRAFVDDNMLLMDKLDADDFKSLRSVGVACVGLVSV